MSVISITGIRESRVLLLSPLQFDTAQALLIHESRCVHKLCIQVLVDYQTIIGLIVFILSKLVYLVIGIHN